MKLLCPEAVLEKATSEADMMRSISCSVLQENNMWLSGDSGFHLKPHSSLYDEDNSRNTLGVILINSASMNKNVGILGQTWFASRIPQASDSTPKRELS